MAEQNKSEVVERMHTIDKVLDEYESSIGLNKYEEVPEYAESVNKYLGMSRDKIEQLSVEDCAYASYILSSFSFHIQRASNRELSRLNWAKSQIKDVICKVTHQYQGNWHNQEQQAILDNEYTRKLNSIQTYCQQRLDRLTYLSSSIRNVADTFNQIQKAKVKVTFNG